ncbi:MAG: hypothetical protein AUI63_03700 [Gemmatimonadetes bacterium 13_1_40CM_2_60_3]|nr:MAG: hypothetical protein AUI63_03700 [Gemmatimonadetes bacterium 13_1_40CM_2_60_3]
MLFLFFVQDVTHIDGGYRPLVRVNVLDLGLSLAGFQVIMSGRFWVIAEGVRNRPSGSEKRLELRKVDAVGGGGAQDRNRVLQ